MLSNSKKSRRAKDASAAKGIQLLAFGRSKGSSSGGIAAVAASWIRWSRLSRLYASSQCSSRRSDQAFRHCHPNCSSPGLKGASAVSSGPAGGQMAALFLCFYSRKSTKSIEMGRNGSYSSSKPARVQAQHPFEPHTLASQAPPASRAAPCPAAASSPPAPPLSRASAPPTPPRHAIWPSFARLSNGPERFGTGTTIELLGPRGHELLPHQVVSSAFPEPQTAL